MQDSSELEETHSVSARLYTRHIDYLNKINQNQSLAIRTVLDSVMSGQEQANRKAILDHSIQWICFGFFFFILTILIRGIPYFVSLILGTFLLVYGGIGGLQLVLRRTNR